MKKKTLQKNFKVASNNKIKGGYFKLVLDAADIASIANPGQFVMVEVSQGTLEPLLRRPMSIHSLKKDKIEILYEVLGEGTKILSRKKSGEYLNVIGPLGNGFEIRNSENIIMVAGGMGVAPLLFLAQRLPRRKNLILIGAKNKNGILCEKEFKESGCDVKIATDDGSRGFKGLVTGLLERVAADAASRLTSIYACGPAAMLKGVSSVASKYGISAWGSFEAHMACGIGACMGCVIKVRDQGRRHKENFAYKRVCKEGPVFALNQVIWGKE
jgi:dihydroorotate dehydrogenase electron transfer subunit